MAEVIRGPEPKAYVTGTDHGKANCNWWAYSRKVRNIARNSRITLPTGASLAAVKAFLNVIVYWDGSKYAGERPWLGHKFNIKAVSGVTHYVGDEAVEPAQILVKVLEQISRDFKKIPVNAAEKAAIDTLVAAMDNRDLGVKPYFGGVAGDKPTV